MSDFFVTLPSSASQNDFPDNTVAHFRVKLDKAIELEGKWSVGLSEFQYPMSWNNVYETDSFTMRRLSSNKEYTIKVKPGFYTSPKTLTDAIQQALGSFKFEKAITFFYDDTSRKFALVIKDDDLEVIITKKFANVFGLETTSYLRGVHFSSRWVDIHEGFASIFIYSNVIEHQFVGDVSARLLRVVAVDYTKNAESIVSREFSHVHYLPLERTRIDVIEVLLTKDTGEKVPFEIGKSLVTLHFKKTE